MPRTLLTLMIKVLRKRMRPILLSLIVIFTILQVVALSPSSVDETQDTTAIDPENLIPRAKKTLARGIPKDRVPEYSVDQFNYVSSQGTEKQWKLISEKAFLYNGDKLVHTRVVEAHLYDPDGKITVVTGDEGKYFMNQRDLEIFGNVKTVFPDGFVVRSDYLHYRPNDRHIEIPRPYAVQGEGSGGDSSGQKIRFQSVGLDFRQGDGRIFLPEAARFMVLSPTGEKTMVESDQSTIYRSRQVAYFEMLPSRPLQTRFVHITQPTLFTRSRRAELFYGNYSKLVNYMTAFDDVLIKETGDATLKYATSGRADFDARKNIIVLTQFPQVYQDKDTVTGETIILHRETDLVEVTHSNSYSEGRRN